MAYSEFLAERVRLRLTKNGPIREIKMMGGLIFMVNEKMCLGIDQEKETGENRLMVRVGKLPYKELLSKDNVRKMDITGKVMRGFLLVESNGFDKEEDLDFWVQKGLKFNLLNT